MTDPGVQRGLWATVDGNIAVTLTADNDYGKYGKAPILKLSPDEAVKLADELRSMAAGDLEVAIVHGLRISLEPDDALEVANELESVATPLVTRNRQ
jgi:hypothetical protein